MPKVSKKKKIRVRKKVSRKKTTRKPAKRRSTKKRKKNGLWWSFFKVALWLGLLASVMMMAWLWQLDRKVQAGFNTPFKRVPAHLFSRPYGIEIKQKLNLSKLKKTLLIDGYRQVNNISSPGEFAILGSTIDIYKRANQASQKSLAARVNISQGRVQAITNHATAEPINQLLLSSKLIGSLMTGPMEDRIILNLHEVPALLLDALITMEDRRFAVHYGVDPLGILRAMVQNFRAGKVSQGGSTLTQQLVKNLYLDNSRTLKRKVNEALMSLIIEWRYSKAEILERYLNTIFLGQSGNRAIHGFGLAAQHYYNRKLSDLNSAQIAMLVGMIPAPSAYNPFRNLKRAKERRNLVLDTLHTNGYISRAEVALHKQAPLGVVKTKQVGAAQYGAYTDLLNRQLGESYGSAYLQSAGVKVYSTLDETIQKTAQKTFALALSALEATHKIKSNSLQGAMIILDPRTGEILSLIGNRKGNRGEFNRALDSRRPIGSLIKPAVYLTALLNPERYSVTSLIEDSPLSVPLTSGEAWQPGNYDNQFHGSVSIYDALIHSYNVPAVKVGMEVGLDAVATTLKRLGVDEDFPIYPSMLLGSSNLSLFQVAQMYQTMVNGGKLQPLTTLRSVADNQDNTLTKYQSKGEQMVNASADFLLLSVLKDVAQTGTARALTHLMPQQRLAGKTGTTNDYRDSWFAGFGKNYLAVVWVGKDDNSPTGLTGSSGALRVWAQVMANLDVQDLELAPPAGVTEVAVDLDNGGIASSCTQTSAKRFFITGYEPVSNSACNPLEDKIGNWLDKWFGNKASLPQPKKRPKSKSNQTGLFQNGNSER